MNKTVLINVNLENNSPSKLEEAFNSVTKTIDEHNAQGYKVVSVTPLTGSKSTYDDYENGAYGYGYGFTTGIIVIFEKFK